MYQKSPNIRWCCLRLALVIGCAWTPVGYLFAGDPCQDSYNAARDSINESTDEAIADIHRKAEMLDRRGGPGTAAKAISDMEKDRANNLAALRSQFNDCESERIKEEQVAREAKRKADQEAFYAKMKANQDALNTRMKQQQEQQRVEQAARRAKSSADDDAFWQNLKNGAANKSFDTARDKFEETTGYSTHPPGEAAANEIKEYNDHLNDAYNNVQPLAPVIVPGIQKIGNNINSLLNAPQGYHPSPGRNTITVPDSGPSGYSGLTGAYNNYSPGPSAQAVANAEARAEQAEDELNQYQARAATEQKARAIEAQRQQEIGRIVHAVDALNSSPSLVPGASNPPTQTQSSFKDLTDIKSSSSGTGTPLPPQDDFLDLLTTHRGSDSPINPPQAGTPNRPTEFKDLLKP